MSFTINCVVQTVFIVFGIVGNLATLLTYVGSRKLRKPSNLPIVVLTISDLLVLCINIAIIVNTARETRPSGLLCQVMGIFIYFVPQMGVDCIVATAATRYINIVHFSLSKTLYTWKRCFGVLTLMVLHSGILSSVPWFGWTRVIYWNPIKLCAIDWRYNLSSAVPTITLGMFMPNCLFSFCYMKIYFTYRESRRRVEGHATSNLPAVEAVAKRATSTIDTCRDTSCETSADVNSQVTTGSTRGQPIKIRKQELNLAIQILVIFIIFVATTSLSATSMLFIRPDDKTSFMSEVTVVMLAINSACNPFIYFYFNQIFRAECVRLVSKVWAPCCRDWKSTVTPIVGTGTKPDLSQSRPRRSSGPQLKLSGRSGVVIGH